MRELAIAGPNTHRGRLRQNYKLRSEKGEKLRQESAKPSQDPRQQSEGRPDKVHDWQTLVPLKAEFQQFEFSYGVL
jgi:hypothetical protein